MSYRDFLTAKTVEHTPTGIVCDLSGYPLFPHQRELAEWALRRGRAAIFASTGLGKTRMHLAWAHAVVAKTGRPTIVLAPLAVAEQTVEEGRRIGVEVRHVREQASVVDGVNVCNYERLHRLDPSAFGGVVLDESSIIKHHDARTFALLLEAFERTDFKLCATATPAPNDWTELGTHAEFLGVRSRTEMLSEFFVHDGGDTQTWRLKGHARHEFWRWVASWGAMIQSPADLGHDDANYRLPKLSIHEHIIETGQAKPGELFAAEAQTLSERRDARRASLDERVTACARKVAAEPREPWIIWCDLNAEGDALRKAIPGAVEIRGSDTIEEKEARLTAFARGEIRVLVTKPSIAGFGLNWQHCARMAFVGVTDSFEAYYQAVRRCWRFGQKRPVDVHIFASDLEGAVVANLKRKEADALAMGAALSAETASFVRENVLGVTRERNPYNPSRPIQAPAFLRTGT
ncbi:MAG: helicase [Burkholderiales bacterium]|nr:helicase [Burkholderiales bacterium]